MSILQASWQSIPVCVYLGSPVHQSNYLLYVNHPTALLYICICVYVHITHRRNTRTSVSRVIWFYLMAWWKHRFTFHVIRYCIFDITSIQNRIIALPLPTHIDRPTKTSKTTNHVTRADAAELQLPPCKLHILTSYLELSFPLPTVRGTLMEPKRMKRSI